MFLVSKIKTLLTNPKGVYIKYIGKKNRKSEKKGKVKKGSVSLDKIKNENVEQKLSTPRAIYCIETINNKLEFKRYQKNISSPSFFTVIFLENKRYVTDCELSYMINKATEFVSFREKTLFFADVINCDKTNIHSVTRDNVWRSSPFLGLKNAIFVNPKSNVVDVVRSTSHVVKTIAYFDEQPDEDVIDSYDFIILRDGLLPVKHRNYIFVESYLSAVKEIGRFCSFNGSRPFDALVPVISSSRFISCIDELNGDNFDAVIFLNGDPAVEFDSFIEVVNNISNKVSSILIRESKSMSYRTLINEKDTSTLIQQMLKDGLKVEVINDRSY